MPIYCSMPLDEALVDSEREGLLDLITTIREWSLSGLHLLVTSRDLFDIRESLHPTDDEDVRMKNGAVDQEYADTISFQLSHDVKLKRCKSRHDDILSILTDRAQGSFRYVECQLNALKKAPNEVHLNRKLYSLPRDLYDTYERILEEIEEDYNDDVRRILTLLCFSTRPLTVDELLHAHAVDLADPPHLDFGRLLDLDSLRDICLGLTDIIPDTTDPLAGALTVHIAHYSVQEYLESDRIRQGKVAMFGLQGGPSHAGIARICLVYLLGPEFTRDFLDPLDKQFLEDFPLARFAAMYWHRHYTSTCGDRAEIEYLIRRLYNHERCFVMSIRLHDPVNPKWDRALKRKLKTIGTPLYYAASLGLENLIDDLLASGGDLNTKQGSLGTPLQAASARGHQNTVRMLLDRGADFVGAQACPLSAACRGGHFPLVQYLLHRGADIHTCHEYAGTALHAAVGKRHLDITRLLLDLDAQSKSYGSVLNASIVGNNQAVVELLLDHLDIQVEGGFGPALCTAAALGHFKLVELFLERGADVDERNRNHRTALQLASLWGKDKVVEFLIDRGVDVNATGGDYGDALQHAIFGEHKHIEEILLARGAKNPF